MNTPERLLPNGGGVSSGAQSLSAERALRFLSEASALLSDSLDLHTTLERVACMAVPPLADYCIIDLVGEDGLIERVAAVHADPAMERLVSELRCSIPDRPPPEGVTLVLRTGQPQLVAELPEAVQSAAAQEAEHVRVVQVLGLRSSAIVPLVARGHVIGALQLYTTDAVRRYGPADLPLIEELARRAAVAIDNAQLYDAERRARAAAELAATRTRRLQTLTAALAEALTVEQVASVVVDQGIAAVQAKAGSLTLLDGRSERVVVVAAAGYHEEVLRAYRSFPLTAETPLAESIRTGAVVVLESATAVTARYPHLAEAVARSGAEGTISVPLVIGGNPAGAIGLSFATPRVFEPAEVALLTALAQQCAQAIERARLYDASRRAREAAERAAERTARLQAITAALAEALTPGEVAAAVVDQSCAAMGAIRGAVGLLRPDGVTIELIYHTGYEPELTERYRTFPLSADLPFAEAIRDGAVICVESAEDITERYADLDAALSRHFYASIIAPLYIGARRVGALGIAFPEARSFDDEDRAFVLAVSRLCAQALERAQLFDAAQEAVRLRDIFFSVAAHELKTPLTALLGQAQLLQRRAVREGFLSERDERTVVVIASQANRLNTLVNALLDIARIEQGSLRIEHEPVDLAVLLRQVVAEVQPTSDLHALICEVPERGLVVQGDPLRLEQVVQNLLGNAIKYSPAGGTVLVRAERADGVARLMVSDAGIGIPAEALPQLFTRFYRGRNAAERYIVGMGIGLYVVKEIVTLHGGTVHAESVEGQGSSFTVELPLAALE